MKSEMDVLGMDERQRLFWLQANRATLIVVGLVWIGMIVWRAAHAYADWFMITMVPVFGLVRLGVYLYHARKGL